MSCSCLPRWSGSNSLCPAGADGARLCLALAEPANYAVPNIGKWIAVETLSGAVQFTLAGLAL